MEREGVLLVVIPLARMFQRKCLHWMFGFTGGQCLQASEGASMSSSTANCFSMGGVNFAAADLADGDLRVGLGEVRGGSLPPMRGIAFLANLL